MRVAVIGEGRTEFYCLPTIAGRLGNTVIKQMQLGGSNNSGYDWDRYFEARVAPAVEIAAVYHPDKIVVVLDREDRPDCCAELASRGLEIIKARCGHLLCECNVGVVISNRKFECLLFADYEAVDRLPILRCPASAGFSATTTEEENVLAWIRHDLESGLAYDKLKHGKFLAQRIRLSNKEVLDRSRSLRKLVKELKPSAGSANLRS